MIIYKTLENTGIETLHKAFVDAFSDYQVKLDLPLWKFEEMLKRRGYDKKASIGAFDNESLVGFILNGIRKWNGKLTSYDTGTAVIKTHRKQGITSNMFLKAKEFLKEMGVEQYLLEVIQNNSAAVELYKKEGFEILREFDCFYIDKNSHKEIETFKVDHVNMLDLSKWKELIEFWDFEPSWQNSINSVNAVADTFIYSVVYIDDKIVGYGIIDKKTGDIPQIAVSKNFRNRGIGRSILTDLINNTQANKINIINVDSKATPIKEFLIKLRFEQSVSQYEMILKL